MMLNAQTPTRPAITAAFEVIPTGAISAAQLEKYAREGQEPIEADLERVRALGVEPVTGNFVHEGDLLRHDYDLVAERVLALGLERLVLAHQ